jgi:hypothetical protein
MITDEQYQRLVELMHPADDTVEEAAPELAQASLHQQALDRIPPRM